MLPSLVLLALFIPIHSQHLFPAKDLNNIVVTFGSCSSSYYNEQMEPAEVFYKIEELKSDLWIWLGDVAYVDDKKTFFTFSYAGEQVIRKRYHINKERPEYRKLRESTPIVGVWDDHDYGIENGDRYFEHKELTQQLFLDFLDEPENSPRRRQEGVYASYYIGDESKVKVILLDVRYFKDSEDDFKDMLGEVQWLWLEEELSNNKAEYTLIGSGTQFLPDDRVLAEAWYESSKQRLFELIRKYKKSGVILLSGDVHYAEILKYPCNERVGYDLYEFTSSGLTHDLGGDGPFAAEFAKRLFPLTYNVNGIDDKYMSKNFGVIKFSFGTNPGVTYQVRSYDGEVVLKRFIPKKNLTYNEQIINLNSDCLSETPAKRIWNRTWENFTNGEPYLFLFIMLAIIALISVIGILYIVIKTPFVLVKNRSWVC